MQFESFRKKSKKELSKQIESIETDFDVKLDDTFSERKLALIEINELKEKYKLRYNTYLTMLRSQRKGITGAHEQEKDILKAKIWINALNNLDEYINKQNKSEENRVLRGRQLPIINELRNAIERGVTKGYVKLPTGTGKTVIFSQLIEALNLPALIAVPSLTLVKQTGERINQFTTKSHGTYFKDHKDVTKEVTTITYQSLINAVENGIISSNDFPVCIFDEAHKALGPRTSESISLLSDSLQIGFTATAEYSKDHNTKEILPEEIYTMTLHEAIKEGLVNRTKTIHAYTSVDLSSVPIINGNYHKSKLEKSINIYARNMAALELYKNKFINEKAIVNCSGVAHAKEVASLFQKEGVRSAHIDGSMNKDQRDSILKRLADGDLMVVTNARLLLEGFDDPTVSVALNLNPTLSIVDAEQRGGRPARINEKKPEKWAYVIDFIDKNSAKKQVLFSEILGADIAYPDDVIDSHHEYNRNNINNEYEVVNDEVKVGHDEQINNFNELDTRKQAKDRDIINFDEIKIDGLKIVVDAKEIMQITKEHKESRLSKKKWKIENLQEEVIRESVDTSGEYKAISKDHDWPSYKALVKMKGFPKKPDGSNDWDAFLKRSNKTKYWTLEDIKKETLQENIQSSYEYQNNAKKNKWPSISKLKKMKGFPKKPDGSNDWDAFLNRSVETKEWTIDDVKNDTIEKKIRSSYQYQKKSKKYGWPNYKALIKMEGFPKKPDGSNDWDAFLDIKKLTIEDLKKEMIKENITSSGEYQNSAKKNKWPSILTLIKMKGFPKKPDGSNDWDAFLSKV